MFSKFKIEKPEYVLYKRGRAHFEAERSVVSLPLLESYDERIRHLRAENDQHTRGITIVQSKCAYSPPAGLSLFSQVGSRWEQKCHHQLSADCIRFNPSVILRHRTEKSLRTDNNSALS